MWDTVSTWVAALLTLMIFSFLYRDNPLYKFAEHLFVGVSAAYWMCQGFWSTLMPNLVAKILPGQMTWLYPQLEGKRPELIFLVPLVFGCLLLLRLIPRLDHLSRWAVALVVGWTAGTNMMRYLQSDFVGQVYNTMKPLVVIDQAGFNLVETLNNTFLIVGVVCGLVYFFFSKEHVGAFGAASRVGIWFLMVAFGAAFGYTVMARISLLIGRLAFLGHWLGNLTG